MKRSWRSKLLKVQTFMKRFRLSWKASDFHESLSFFMKAQTFMENFKLSWTFELIKVQEYPKKPAYWGPPWSISFQNAQERAVSALVFFIVRGHVRGHVRSYVRAYVCGNNLTEFNAVKVSKCVQILETFQQPKPDTKSDGLQCGKAVKKCQN